MFLCALYRGLNRAGTAPGRKVPRPSRSLSPRSGKPESRVCRQRVVGMTGKEQLPCRDRILGQGGIVFGAHRGLPILPRRHRQKVVVDRGGLVGGHERLRSGGKAGGPKPQKAYCRQKKTARSARKPVMGLMHCMGLQPLGPKRHLSMAG